MLLPNPIDFKTWLVDHGDKLKPPVNNYCVYSGDDFIVMAVGGPNRRNDFHINQTEEWFYQIKGEMCLRVHEEGQFRDIVIGEGQMFLLPGNVPHNPIRFADTIGLVIERRRLPSEHVDRLRWYCDQCKEAVYEESFFVTDINTQLKEVIERYSSDEALRTCKSCGHLNSPK